MKKNKISLNDTFGGWFGPTYSVVGFLTCAHRSGLCHHYFSHSFVFSQSFVQTFARLTGNHR